MISYFFTWYHSAMPYYSDEMMLYFRNFWFIVEFCECYLWHHTRSDMISYFLSWVNFMISYLLYFGICHFDRYSKMWRVGRAHVILFLINTFIYNRDSLQRKTQKMKRREESTWRHSPSCWDLSLSSLFLAWYLIFHTLSLGRTISILFFLNFSCFFHRDFSLILFVFCGRKNKIWFQWKEEFREEEWNCIKVSIELY